MKKYEFSLTVILGVLLWSFVGYSCTHPAKTSIDRLHDQILMNELIEAIARDYYNVLTPQSREVMRPWMQQKIKSYGGDPNILYPNYMIPPGYHRETLKR